ncbi:MAG: hypothetical protein IJI34_06570 [Clostridia bacterium]|nr:hypothetical protein [Clostridia bacterium]
MNHATKPEAWERIGLCAVFLRLFAVDDLAEDEFFRAGAVFCPSQRKDTPRLLNLLKTELWREYELMRPVKAQTKQRTRNDEPERDPVPAHLFPGKACGPPNRPRS